MKNVRRLRIFCDVSTFILAAVELGLILLRVKIPAFALLLFVVGAMLLYAASWGFSRADKASAKHNIEEQIKKALAVEFPTEEVRELVRLISDAIADFGQVWTEKTVLEIAQEHNMPQVADGNMTLNFGSRLSVVIYPDGDVSAFAKEQN